MKSYIQLFEIFEKFRLWQAIEAQGRLYLLWGGGAKDRNLLILGKWSLNNLRAILLMLIY